MSLDIHLDQINSREADLLDRLVECSGLDRETSVVHERCESPLRRGLYDPVSACAPKRRRASERLDMRRLLRALIRGVGDVRDDEKRRREEASSSHLWFHSIDLGRGVISDGIKSQSDLARELDAICLPNLTDKTVLDIGAWDGYFSFAAERLGAKRVVALDHYAWSTDIPASREYNEKCRRAGVPAAAYETVKEVWRPDTLPGRRGFDIAREFLQSRVEPVVADFMTEEVDAVGMFDIVLFLGVLYHLRHPFAALERLARVTRDVAIIETVCVVVPDREHHALWEFFETTELNGDPTNWWAPNIKALTAACRASGFGRVEVIASPAADAPPAEHEWHYGRAIVHAHAAGV